MDQTVRLFRTSSLAPRGAVRPKPKCCAIVQTPEVFAYFLFLIPISVVFTNTTRLDVRLRLHWEIHVSPERIRPGHG